MSEDYSGRTARALWDFNASREDELQMEEDDLVLLKSTPDGGWWEGEVNGVSGWFPSNYVDILTDEEAMMAYQNNPDVVETQPSSGGIDFEKTRNWYKMYKSQSTQPLVFTPPTPEELQAQEEVSTPERRVAGRQTKVVISTVGSPQVAKKWYDGIEMKLIDKLSDKEKKRQEVIYELIQTEKDYVRDLDIIITVFCDQLRQKKIVNAKDIGVLFSNVEQILPVNQEFLRLLEIRRTESPIIEQVGDIFISISDYLKMYNMYCSNHPYALVKLQNINTKVFKTFLTDTFQKPECRGLDLGSFLIKPVQRICKYPLLLREIIKFTEPGHKDTKNLEIAFEKIEMVVTIVNEATRQAEAVQKMLAIQSRFADKISFLTPGRKLIREEELDEILESKKKQRHVFMFNDIVVISKVAGGITMSDKLKVVENIELHAITLDDPEPDKSTFEITSTQAKYVLSAPDKSSKDKWMKDLDEYSKEEKERKQNDEGYEEEFSRSSAARGSTSSLKSAVSTPKSLENINEEPTSGKVKARIQETQSSAPEFQSLRGNLRKTNLYDDSTASSSHSENHGAAQLKKANQGNKRESQDDATPEFIKAKNNLRRTMYEDTAPSASTSAGTANKSNLQSRARSLTDVTKPDDEKKKKKGFFANLFSKFRKRKGSEPVMSASDSDLPDKKGKAKEEPKQKEPQGAPQGIKQPISSRVSDPSPTSSSPKPVNKARTSTSSAGAELGPIISASIKDFKKMEGAKKDYIYIIEITREKGYYQISKTYDEFYNLHTALIFQFPEEAGRRNQKRIIPDLPLQCMHVTDTIAQQRKRELDIYTRKTLALPEKISKSSNVNKFFEAPAGTTLSTGTPPAKSTPRVINSPVPQTNTTTQNKTSSVVSNTSSKSNFTPANQSSPSRPSNANNFVAAKASFNSSVTTTTTTAPPRATGTTAASRAPPKQLYTTVTPDGRVITTSQKPSVAPRGGESKDGFRRR